MNDEKRNHERYNDERLILNVARPGIKGFLRLNPKADFVDFSLAGLQFKSKQALKPGEALVLDLCIHDIELMEIYGEVVSCKQEDRGLWCCGVKFCFEDKRMKRPNIKRSLLQIEDRLRSLNLYPSMTA